MSTPSLRSFFQAVREQGQTIPEVKATEAVGLALHFLLPRPARLKGGDRCPAPTARKDFDNLAKALVDALNGHAYDDDRRVVRCAIAKDYAGRNETPGCFVVIERLALPVPTPLITEVL